MASRWAPRASNATSWPACPSMAPTEEFEAILYVEQSEREQLESGRPVTLKLDQMPEHLLRGVIVSDFAARDVSM